MRSRYRVDWWVRFELPGRPQQVLTPIVQVVVLLVLSCRHSGPVRNLIGGEIVGDQHRRRVPLPLQKFLGEPGRSPSVPRDLHQNFEDVAVLVDRPPQVFPRTGDLFVETPLVTGAWLMSAQPPGELGPEPSAPGADRLVRHLDPTVRHHQLDLTEREGKLALSRPRALRDDLPRNRNPLYVDATTASSQIRRFQQLDSVPGQLRLRHGDHPNEV